VVALPVFAASVLGWSHLEIGSFMAVWIIGYGLVQASAPKLVGQGQNPTSRHAFWLGLALAAIPLLMAYSLHLDAQTVIIIGLLLFGVMFALNSAVHSYLIVSYAEADGTSKQVGFYYMANAGGRLAGTVLSGYIYQSAGMEACLTASAIMIVLAAWLAFKIPQSQSGTP